MAKTIVVLHVSDSTLAGQEQEFESERVTLGRRQDNDVVFDPEEDLSVSGEHASLEVENGALVLVDNNSRNGTFVNGDRVDGRIHITAGDVVQLGDEGPVIRAYFREKTGMPSTMGEAPAKKYIGERTLHQVISNVVTEERSKAKKIIASVGAGLLCVAVVVLTTVWWSNRQNTDELAKLDQNLEDSAKAVDDLKKKTQKEIDEKIARLQAELDLVKSESESLGGLMKQLDLKSRELELQKSGGSAEAVQRTREDLQRLADDLDRAKELLNTSGDQVKWEDLVAKIAPCVFLCVGVNQARTGVEIGTAFAIDSQGTLVTNGDTWNRLESSSNRYVVQNRTGRRYEIVDYRLHPDYSPDRSADRHIANLALLKIGVSKWPVAPVVTASDEELRELKVGAHLGSLGFPAELEAVYVASLKRGVPGRSAVATFKDGWVGRMTNQDMEIDEPENSVFIQHSASLTDGADGSPLFDSQGRVVAVHVDAFRISYLESPEKKAELSSPAEIGYALRIDVVRKFKKKVGW